MLPFPDAKSVSEKLDAAGYIRLSVTFHSLITGYKHSTFTASPWQADFERHFQLTNIAYLPPPDTGLSIVFADDSLVVVESPPELATVTAVMDNGLWSKSPDGKFHNKGRDEVPDAVVSGR